MEYLNVWMVVCFNDCVGCSLFKGFIIVVDEWIVIDVMFKKFWGFWEVCFWLGDGNYR